MITGQLSGRPFALTFTVVVSDNQDDDGDCDDFDGDDDDYDDFDGDDDDGDDFDSDDDDDDDFDGDDDDDDYNRPPLWSPFYPSCNCRY